MFLNVGNRIVEVKVIVKPRNKSTYLRVKDNVIVITSFKKQTEKDIKKFIEQYKSKILEILDNEDKKADIIHLLGKEYRLKLEIGKRLSRVEGLNLIVYVDSFNDLDIKKRINEVYFNVLSEILKKNHLKYESVFKILFSITYEIKDVKTYFGKCYFKEKRIVLATKLAKYPIELILSVLAHELTHFYVQDHSPKFYEFIEQKVPGYRRLQSELRSIKYQDKY